MKSKQTFFNVTKGQVSNFLRMVEYSSVTGKKIIVMLCRMPILRNRGLLHATMRIAMLFLPIVLLDIGS